MKQYVTTQLVEAEQLEHGPYRVHFPAMGFGAVVPAEKFDEQCHAIDRLEVGFGLALEGMKHGLRFTRIGWDKRPALGLHNTLLAWFVDGEPDFADVLMPDDLVAEDWVVSP